MRYLLTAGALALVILRTNPVFAETYSAADLSNAITEEDIRDLYAQGDISESDIDTLLELLLDPVNINRADRDGLYQLPYITYDLADAIIQYRREKGPFETLDGLMAVPGFSPELLAQIANFSDAPPPLIDRLGLKGEVKIRSAYTYGYIARSLDDPSIPSPSSTTSADALRAADLAPIPETYMRVRSKVGDRIKTGVVLLEQASVGAWVYDPNNLSFLVKWGQPTLTVEKAYVSLNEERYTAIVGSYSAGFGQRLTFDNSQRNRANGFYADDRISNALNFSAPERLFGTAFTWKGGRVGKVVLSGTGFASFRPYDLYQARFVVSPPAGVQWGELAAGVSPHAYLASGDKLPYVTYPNLFTEGILGGHLDAELPGMHRLGLTVYGARIHKRAPIDFTNATPDRPMFGAIGLDGTSTFGPWNLAWEAALMDSGGGGAYLRSARSWKKQGELVLSLRHYGEDFDNPHSRGSAQADTYSNPRPDKIEVGGESYDPDSFSSFDRDRDEQGFRVEGYYQLKPKVQIKGYGDIWRHPSSNIWDTNLQARVDYQTTDKLELDFLARYQDRDLALFGRQYSFQSSASSTVLDFYNTPEDGENAAPNASLEDEADAGAAGARITAGFYATSHHIPETTLWFYYRRYYEDASQLYVEPGCSRMVGGYRVGNISSIKAQTNLPMGLRTAVRARYLDEDFYGSRGQRQLEGYAQLEWRSGDGRFMVQGRYTAVTTLADPGDQDLQYCAENPPALGLPNGFPTASTFEDDERLRTPLQTISAMFQYRF